MSFVKCSVDGCTRKLQPILKVDPRDRATWLYQDCDVCLKPACEKHSELVKKSKTDCVGRSALAKGVAWR